MVFQIKQRFVNLFISGYGFIWFPLIGFLISTGIRPGIFSKESRLDLISHLSTMSYFSLLSLGIALLHQIQELKPNIKLIQHENWRHDRVLQLLTFAKSRIWILTTWLPGDEQYLAPLRKIARNGKIDLRILVASKGIIQVREKELTDYCQSNTFLRNEVLKSIIPKNVQFLDFNSHMFCVIVDSKVFYAPTLFQKQAVEGSALELTNDEPFGRMLIDNHEELWNSTKNVS